MMPSFASACGAALTSAVCAMLLRIVQVIVVRYVYGCGVGCVEQLEFRGIVGSVFGCGLLIALVALCSTTQNRV